MCVSLQWMLVSLTTEFTIGVRCDPESRAIGFPPGRGFREDRNSTIVMGCGFLRDRNFLWLLHCERC